jgi:kynurenine formamidase
VSFQYIDLSYEIQNGMSVYPGDSEVVLVPEKELEKDGYHCYRLETNTHAGTHIDAPMHLIANPLFIGDYPLERFCGRVVLLDVRGDSVIEWKDSYDQLIEENSMVLFYTGHAEKYGTPQYYTEHPVIHMKLANILVKKKIKCLGLDAPSPDNAPFSIHKILLAQGVFILENLRNLEALLEKEFIELFVFPLKIKGDASMVRAVARFEQEGCTEK